MAGTLRLTKLLFHAGPSPGAPSLTVNCGTVLLLVGPNNSGKSLALREIERWCTGDDSARRVVAQVDLDFPQNPDDAVALLQPFETSPPAGTGLGPDDVFLGQHTFTAQAPYRTMQLNRTGLRNIITSGNQSAMRRQLSMFYTVRLDGRTRFALTEQKATGDLQAKAQNHLWALFVDRQARERVRDLAFKAFGAHFVIDPTAMQTFRMRMSSRPPTSVAEEQALDEAARAFHRAADLITDLGDGVQAFVGLLAAVLSLPHRVLLVDEPEAFLHPPQARRLGENLARIAQERQASLAAATHSADFLLGAIESGTDVSVVRLTYSNGVATARSLPSVDLAALSRDPLIRSTGVFDALFHRAAIVTEADGDRVFYGEINRRMLAAGRGISDAVVLNAVGKDTVHRLVGPLRRLGVPAVVLVDLDILQHGDGRWTKLMDACNLPQQRRGHLETEREYIGTVFEALPKSPDGKPAIKSGGVSSLPPPDLLRADVLLAELNSYGIFPVDRGELESWLPGLGVAGHGSAWVNAALGAMGTQEGSPDYTMPAQNDVWAFMDKVQTWTANPDRLGMG